MALDEDGLTRDDHDDFRIRDELPNVDDEVGGETCVRFQGEHHYPTFGEVGGPDGDWNLEYEVAGSDSAKGYETARTDGGTTTGADGY